MARRLHNRSSLKHYRRVLRNNSTPAETALWTLLRNRQVAGRKFRRQHSIGPFIVDFYCPSERLALELDGTCHDDIARSEYDTEREAYLEGLGIRVIRFENSAVFNRPEEVLNAIEACFRDS